LTVSYTQNDREHLLAGAFVELADTLVDDYDVIDVLDRLVAHSVTLLAADAAGIMLADSRGRLRVVASSSEESDWTELMQIQADQGPCIDCVRTGEPVTVTDLDDAAERWPEFTAALAGRGTYQSVHALPLRLRREAIGALNLFHTRAGPLPEADLRLGQALADIATIGILQERAVRHSEIVTEQLQTALNSRVIVEQAKGVLAQTGGLAMDAAFDRLRRHARSHNLLLAGVARRVVTEPDFAHQILSVKTR
jgi:transcriptional regulator with GAF, ATPase, and Fis domain